MDEHLELDIRKGYSKHYSEFKGLSIWIEGLLEQLIFHDPLVYTFDVRVKTIESLLKKTIVRMDKEHKESFTCTCFNDVRNHIKDIVGARILVYVPAVLQKSHALLTAMDSGLLIVKEIRIHYKEAKRTKVIEDIISASKLLEPRTILNTESNKAYNVLRQRERVAASVVTDNLVDALAYVWGAAGTDQTPSLPA